MYYIEKCSGKYENNVVAGRYVYQLAQEVLSLLSGIRDEIEMHQEIRKLAEERLNDWDRNFPQALKVIGGPKEVANRLIEMQNEINKLYRIIEDYEDQLKDEKMKMKSTIDDQLYLSSVGVMREREQMNDEVNKIRHEYEQRKKLREEKYSEEISKIHQKYQERHENTRRRYEVRAPR